MLELGFLNKIAELTECNEHTEARLLIAKAIGNQLLVDFYTKVLVSQNKIGYLHPKLSMFRNLVESTLLKEAEHKLGLNVYPYL